MARRVLTTAVLTVRDDKGGVATSSAQVTVTAQPPLNRNPSITSTPVTTATEGQPYAYDVNATDPDAGDTLGYGLTQAPSGMTIDPASGVIAWTPAATPRALGQCDGAGHRREGWLGDAELRHCRRGGSTAQPEPHDYVDSGHDGDGRAAVTAYDVDASDPNAGDISDVLAHAGAKRDDDQPVERRDLLGAAGRCADARSSDRRCD